MATFSGPHSAQQYHAQPDGMNHDLTYDINPPSSERSPLGNLSFFKNLNAEKKQTKDGQPAKRRGPKPDSKPALTRRQELNRQAQRTHRERKEMYIKALEQEVLKLKEAFIQTNRERDAIADENRRLKDLLSQHGISYDFGSTPIKFQRENSSYGASSSGSISGSYRGASDSTGFSPPPSGLQHQMGPPQNMQTGNRVRNMAQLPNNRLDYDNIGIEFVLTLERPCMDHMQYLMVRSHNPEGQPVHHPMENPDDSEHLHASGHALMATGPPYSHVMNKPADPYPHQMPADLDTSALAKLLDLSSRLPPGEYREGEITPIMAWSMILRHARLSEIDNQDIEQIKQNLSTKVRCYGFGAVIEEFEVEDAILSVFAEKDNVPMMNLALDPHPIAVY